MSPYSLDDVHQLLKGQETRETPFFFLDAERLHQNAQKFVKTFKDYSIYFSVKANSHPILLSIFHQEGICFDVASWGEIETLMKIGVPASHMIYSAPTKYPRDIERAFKMGIDRFAFDSKIELEKIAHLAPGSKVHIRLAVDNNGSDYPLERKFGTAAENALVWMPYAREMGLIPWGLTFHVGSQNRNPGSWAHALHTVHPLFKALHEKGIDIQTMDLGGGFPGEYGKEIPSLEEIVTETNAARRKLYPSNLQFYIEPGRGLPNTAGVLVSSVLNRTDRCGKEWLYLDAGVFNGLDEARSGFRFPVLTDVKSNSVREFVLAGPTCDSGDVIMDEVELPENVTYGDRLYLLSTGAYTNSVQRYNGIDFPDVIIQE